MCHFGTFPCALEESYNPFERERERGGEGGIRGREGERDKREGKESLQHHMNVT